MTLGIDLFKYNMAKTMTAGNKVLFLSVNKDTVMRRKILWLIGSKNLKVEWEKERKSIENGKFLLIKKIPIFLQKTILHQQKRKRRPNVGDNINRHCQIPRLSAIQTPMRNRIMTGLKLLLKMKNLSGSYPKVWLITQTNIFKSTFQRILWKRLYYATVPSQIILIIPWS